MLPKDRHKCTNCKLVPVSLCAVVLLTSLGLVAFVQRRELLSVNQRLSDLEDAIHAPRKKRAVDETEHLVDLVKKHCEEVKDTCAQGPRGPPGPKGEEGPRGSKGEKGDPGCKEEGDIQRNVRVPACCLNLAGPTFLDARTITINTVIGHTILLPCKASGYPPPSVHWNLPVTASRYKMASTGLTIKGVIASDDRTYKCTINNIFGKIVKTIRLSVSEPLSVNVTTSATNHTEGTPGTITLTCNYRGIPDPTVKWVHTGPLGTSQTITAGVNTNVTNGPISKAYVSTLTLNNPDIFAAGSYLCKVSNAVEQKHDNVTIVIYAKPRVVTPPKTQTITEDSNVTLSCQVVGFPPPKITWQFPQSQGHPPFNAILNADQTVTLTGVDAFNEGKYTCHAANRYGSAEGSGMISVIKPVTIQVTSQMNSLKGAPAIALDCHATGDPTPSVSWSKLYGHINVHNPRYIMLPNGDFILTAITPATMETDSGVYKCTATNGVTSTYKLSVVYMDMGQLNCSSSFEDCSTHEGVACGGRCPLGCASTPGVLFGYHTYSGNSYVCQAAIQYGSINDSGGMALWYIRNGSRMTFNGTTAHGIKSSPTGPIHVAATVVNVGKP